MQLLGFSNILYGIGFENFLLDTQDEYIIFVIAECCCVMEMPEAD